MEKIKERFRYFAGLMRLDETFLVIVLLALVGIMVLMISVNIISNAQLRTDVVKNLKERRILIIDSYGSQYYKDIGVFDDSTIAMFAMKSLKTLIETTYENTFVVDYAKKYANGTISELIEKSRKAQNGQLVLDNGAFKLTWTNMKLIEVNERAGYWSYEFTANKVYKKMGGQDVLGDYVYRIRIDRTNEMAENDVGLIITSLTETKVVVEK